MKIKLNQIILLALLITLTISKVSAGINEELIECCKSGNLECVKALVEKGADVNAEVSEYNTNEYGSDTIIYRPLSVAVDKGNAQLVEYLLKKGANPNSEDDVLANSSYLWTSVWDNKLDIFKLLLDYGAKYNWNQLLCVSVRSSLEISEFIIKKGANVNYVYYCPKEGISDPIGHNGYTPIMLACTEVGDYLTEEQQINIIRLLIKKGANINFENRVLGSAVSPLRSSNIIEHLIKSGANKESINNGLKTTTYYPGRDNLQRLLIKAGANRAVLINSKQRQWWFCDNSYNCINKMRITFENNSFAPISSVTFMLTIKSGSGSVLYKKKHTVKCSIDHGESAPCKEFMLAEKVWDYDSGFGDGNNISIDVEVISVK